MDLVGYLVSFRIAAFCDVGGRLHRAGHGAWVPRIVRGESIGNLFTVRTHCGLTRDVKYPLSANQLRLPKSLLTFASHRCASVSAGNEVPILGRASVAGVGFGFDVVAADFGNGERGRSCPDSEAAAKVAATAKFRATFILDLPNELATKDAQRRCTQSATARPQTSPARLTPVQLQMSTRQTTTAA